MRDALVSSTNASVLACASAFSSLDLNDGVLL
jgi:hypothetical protein